MIHVDQENWPTLPEALKAKEEVDILFKQTIGLFTSRPVKFVVAEIKHRCAREGLNHENFVLMLVLNYGYIMGVRAERARRKERQRHEG